VLSKAKPAVHSNVNDVIAAQLVIVLAPRCMLLKLEIENYQGRKMEMSIINAV